MLRHEQKERKQYVADSEGRRVCTSSGILNKNVFFRYLTKWAS